LTKNNTDRDFYYTIDTETRAEYRDRGSRFIAYAFPVRDAAAFKTRLRDLKEEHHKAVHHCFAYRMGTDGNAFRNSDDGEPSGSAGRPIMGQIDSRNLTDMAVIVVRYFGGQLLGVPGLIKAYKSSASLALEKNHIVRKPVLVDYRLQFDYLVMNEVMHLLKKKDCVIRRQESGLSNIFEIGIPLSDLETCRDSLARVKGLSMVKI